jgi:hypothetical protein
MEFYYNKEMLNNILRLRFNNEGVHVSNNYGRWKHRKSGSSMEFQDYRNYEKGDELRKVDWSYYGRSRELMVKTYNDERKKTVNIFLDNTKSMDYGKSNKYKRALEIAFYIISIIVKGYDDVRLYYLDGIKASYCDFSKNSHPDNIYDTLSKIQLSQSEDYFTNLMSIPVRRGNSLVISDFYSDKVDEFLEHISVGVRCGSCLNILTGEEINPDYRGLSRLIDSESNSKREINIDAHVVKKYKEIVDNHLESIVQSTDKWGFSYSILDPRKDLETIFFHDMVNLGLLR